MNIVLIGMRGAGKSNISRRLSVMTKWPVLSTDLLIQYENQGKTIAQIIAETQGDWRAFRDMEFVVVRKVACLDNVIIDCGGGVVVDLDDQGNEIFSSRKIDLLKQNGKIIWLKGDIHRLAAKVKDDQQRPSLDQMKSTEELMQRRMPFYKKAADVIVDIEDKGRRRLAKKVYRVALK
ncbi:MAG: shikimate kinase [Sedimenticola sp.]|nr:MAG: shikimate kinase [Sedimenticola sp.]